MVALDLGTAKRILLRAGNELAPRELVMTVLGPRAVLSVVALPADARRELGCPS